jgi:hypothetical protein
LTNRFHAMTYLRYLSIVAIIVGASLAAAPWWWPSLVGGKQAWSDADAKEYSQAAANYHHAVHETGHAADKAVQPTAKLSSAETKPTESQKSDAATRYNRDREALNRARVAGQSTATILQCVGIVAVLSGLLGYSASKSVAERASEHIIGGGN